MRNRGGESFVTSQRVSRDLFSLFAEVKRRAYHSEGLVGGIILLITILALLDVKPFHSNWEFAAYAVGIGAITGAWSLIRRIPRFHQNEIGILLAPHADKDVSEELDRLLTEVAATLRSHDLGFLFSIKRLPENRIVHEDETAKSIRQKSGCLLLIWGYYQKGKANGKEYRGFPIGKLNFTYAVPTMELISQYQHDMSKGITDRTWLFRSENELIERDFVTRNVVDVARYIVGTCLLNFGKVMPGKAILGQIIAKPIGTWHGKAGHSVVGFLKNIKAKLSVADVVQANHLYRTRVFKDGKLIKDPKVLDQIFALTEASIANGPNLPAYLQQAIICFLRGEIPQARRLTNKAQDRWPRSPLPEYSLGFLYAYEGDLLRSKSHYKTAFIQTSNMAPLELFHLVEFPEACLELDPERYHLHFALGLVHMELVDALAAKKHFKRFIESATSKDPSNEQWIRDANQYIEDIQQTKGRGS